MLKISPLITLCLVIEACFCRTSFAIPSSQTGHSGLTIASQIQSDIVTRKSPGFANMLKLWENRYGTAAVPPLLQVASSNALEDPDRYIALMGIAKIGGREAAPLIGKFLKDRSWMLRSAALRALSALNNSKTAPEVLPLLKDPSLIVRSEAVDAVRRLHPHGSAKALLETLDDGNNYHGGKAQWVPSKALAALAELHASEVASQLRPLLRHLADPELQLQTIKTLEALTGRFLKPGKSLSERVSAWQSTVLE